MMQTNEAVDREVKRLTEENTRLAQRAKLAEAGFSEARAAIKDMERRKLELLSENARLEFQLTEATARPWWRIW